MDVYALIPDSRGKYALTDEATLPVPTSRYSYRAPTFTPVTGEPVVYSKMLFRDKPAPFVVRGTNKNGLLVQTLVATEHDPIGNWHEVDYGNTTEGYRFKRYILKTINTIVKIGVDANKQRASAARKQQILDDRNEKVGTCPVCFGDFVVDQRNNKNTMVHHGYERPGDGMIHGDCFGVAYPPFELSCAGTKAWHEHLQRTLDSVRDWLKRLRVATEITVETGVIKHGIPVTKKIQKDDPSFAKAHAAKCRNVEMQIKHLEQRLHACNEQIAGWKLAVWPRKASR